MTYSAFRISVATLLAALVLGGFSTAHADPAPDANIPTEGEKIDTAHDELALPYGPWQGAGPSPPTAPPPPDLPAPDARPRQEPRRPLELAIALTTLLPSCGSGRIDDRMCSTVSPGSGADLLLLYRVHPFFALGAEGLLGGFGGRGAGVLSSASGTARFFGVLGRVYFADDGPWDPYLALTLGAGSITLRSDEASSADTATSGFGGRIAGGVDYRLGSHWRVGAGGSFAHWVAYRELGCDAAGCREQPAVFGRLLGFATLGLRVTASLGDVL